MAIFETRPILAIASKADDGDGLFNALTPFLNSTGLKYIRLHGCVQGNGGVAWRFGIRTSPDGVDWTVTPLAAPDDEASWVTASGWQDPVGFFNPADIEGAVDHPFMQIGMFLRNATGDDLVKNAMAQLKVESVDVVHTTLVTPLQPVTTNGTTGEIFVPLTSGIGGTLAQDVRFGVERRVTTSSDLRVRPAFQVSDDGDNWDMAETISGYTGYLTGDGVAVGTTWTNITANLTKSRVRFGVLASNASSGEVEVGLIGLRIDLRGPS